MIHAKLLANPNPNLPLLSKICTMKKLILLAAFVVALSIAAFGQTKIPSTANQPSSIKASPAYAELLLRYTDLESDLESLLVSYTEEFPKVKEDRYELGLIKRDMDKILSLNQADSGKLTLALGKLMVRRAELETDLWAKRNQYGEEHPEVKRGKKKVEVFDKAIKQILP